MDKARLRKTYQQARQLLTTAQLKTESRQLSELLYGELQQLRGCIHVFLPIRAKMEIDTWPILHWLWEHGWTTCTSITNFTTNTLTHTKIDAGTRFVDNKWGVPEPINPRMVLPIAMDVVLIPMLCFDLRGHRVGYGRGYYDRFLSECRADVKKIGLCLAEPVTEIADTSALDMAMDVCITPQKVYKFEEYNGSV